MPRRSFLYNTMFLAFTVCGLNSPDGLTDLYISILIEVFHLCCSSQTSSSYTPRDELIKTTHLNEQYPYCPTTIKCTVFTYCF